MHCFGGSAMEGEKEITPELTDAIREVIGKKVKISLLASVKLETKPDKLEPRILAFTACRLFVLTCKIPSKIDSTFNYLDLECIESKKPNQLHLSADGKIFKFTSAHASPDRADQMVLHLCTAIRSIFPSVPFERVVRKLDLVPADRLLVLQSVLENLDNRDNYGPCGGYSRVYACMCDYFCCPYREEVAWDVDTIYHAHNTREFCLQDFDHLDPKDMVPIIAALEHNTWFTRLKASNTKLIPEAAEQIIRVMKKSTSIEELILDNIGMKMEFIHRLSLALLSNGSTAVHTLNFASNFIEDKGLSASLYGFLTKPAPASGAVHLGGPIIKAAKGMTHLNLSRTVLSSKGVNSIGHALTLNKFMSTTLKVLNLSENSCRDDISNLLRFLGQPNTLTHLDLSGTECNLENLFLALSTGCHSHLSHLNVARNVFAMRKKDAASATQPLKQFFTSAKSLTHVDLSYTKLSSDYLKSLLLGFASNAHLSDVKLALSGNDFKSPIATQIMETCLPDIPCLSSLDLSDCNLDQEFYVAVLAISRNSHLRELSLSKNFQNTKPKNLPQLLNALVHLIHDDASRLQTLSLADCRLRSGTNLILSALGSNQYLKTIDLSGNQMLDSGARILAKSMQVNAKLETIHMDNNGVTHVGYQDLAWALAKNRSVRYIPYPVFDATQSMKVVPDKFPVVFHEIEKLLWRNQEPQTKSDERLVRLKQGVLFSNSQQMVDQLICQVQESIDTLKRCPIVEELDTSALEEEGASLIADANRYKQFLYLLHQSTSGSTEYAEGVNNLLEFFVSQLSQNVDVQLRNAVENMCVEAEKLYPYIFQRKKSFKADTLAAARVPHDFLIQCVMRQLHDSIQAKMSEVLLSAASRLSDRVLEDIVSTMSSCHNLLNNAIRLHSEWYNAKSKTKGADANDAAKVRGFFPRKFNLRPQSIAGNDADMMAIAEALQLSGQHHQIPPSPTEIPQEESKHLHKLDHINKSRPKPKRNNPASKYPGHTGDDSGVAVDDGLQNFFVSASKTPSGSANRLSWTKAEPISQLPNFPMASPSVPRKDIILERRKETIVEENDEMEPPVLPTRTPFGGNDFGLSNSMMDELKARQGARASGLFNVNVSANLTSVNGEAPGRRSKSPPPPITPRIRPRMGSGRKVSGSRTPGSTDELDVSDLHPPPSPGSASFGPDSGDGLDASSINSESSQPNGTGSLSVRALVSTMENSITSEDFDPTRKSSSLPRAGVSASVSRSKSLRSPEDPPEHSHPPSGSVPPPVPSRPPAKGGLRLKDRVKSLFNDGSSKEPKTTPTADIKTKVLEI